MGLKMKPVIEKVGKLLIKLLIFVFLLGATSYVVPYLITHETYTESSRAYTGFPIAILDHGKPDIVSWHEYQKDVDLYKDKIISAPTQNKYKLSEDGTFKLRERQITCSNYSFAKGTGFIGRNIR